MVYAESVREPYHCRRWDAVHIGQFRDESAADLCLFLSFRHGCAANPTSRRAALRHVIQSIIITLQLDDFTFGLRSLALCPSLCHSQLFEGLEHVTSESFVDILLHTCDRKRAAESKKIDLLVQHGIMSS